MPGLETPPQQEIPETPPAATGRGGSRRYNYLDTHELVMLLEDVDDERSRARFREAMYLAIILWLALVLLYIFVPRWLPRRPVLIVQDRNPKELTYLDTPPDLKNLLKKHPSPNISTHSTEAQTPKPVNVPHPPEPKAGTPQPPAPKAQPQPRPAQQAAPQQAQPQQPQQTAQQAPPQQTAKSTPTPRPSNTPPLVDSPAPSAQKTPVFKQGGSAASQIADAARGSRNTAQDAGDYGSTGRGNAGSGAAGVKVLSDTQGVDFSRYLAHLLADVRRNWLPLIPEEANSPLFKQGITGVRFTILPNGTISVMNLDYSTHDDAINRAAWGSIKSLGQAPPLPKEFHGPNLELRIEFRVNEDRQ